MIILNRVLALSLSVLFSLSLLAGCEKNTDSNQPQIARMSLSASQQEIVDLISHLNHEILLFDYNLGDVFNEMEIWVEIYHYGEFLAEVARLHTLGDQTVPLKNGQLVVEIVQYGNREFRWTLSAGGSRSTSDSWLAEVEDMARGYGSITDPVFISGGQEVILYISKLTTGSIIYSSSDLQSYLEHPEDFADYTYVHIIKARFS